MKAPDLFSQASFLWLEDFLGCRVTNTMISLPAKNNVKTNKNAKQGNPHYFIQTRNLMSTRHMQLSVPHPAPGTFPLLWNGLVSRLVEALRPVKAVC